MKHIHNHGITYITALQIHLKTIVEKSTIFDVLKWGTLFNRIKKNMPEIRS